jgi:hypothetical protein
MKLPEIFNIVKAEVCLVYLLLCVIFQHDLCKNCKLRNFKKLQKANLLVYSSLIPPEVLNRVEKLICNETLFNKFAEFSGI